MNKKNKNGRLIVIMGAIAIIIVTVCAFNKNTIRYKYYEYSIEKNTLLPLLTSIMSMITLTM